MFTNADEVLKFIGDQKVEFVDVRFCDLPGTVQHFTVPVESFDEKTFTDGLMFDGSSIRGFQQIHESDMLLMPDPSTAMLDPFRQHTTLDITFFVHDPLTGVGPDMIIQVYPHYRDKSAVNQLNPHLHNVPLQIAAERGLRRRVVGWLVAGHGGEHDVVGSYRPVDCQRRIIPDQPTLVLLGIIVIDLIDDFGVRFEGAKSVRKSPRNEHLLAALSR
jgi:hypothetical protein